MQFSTALIALFAALTVALPTHVSRQTDEVSALKGQLVEAIESPTGNVKMATDQVTKRGEVVDTVDDEVNPLEDKLPEDEIEDEIEDEVENQVTGADGQVESQVSDAETQVGSVTSS